MILTAAFLICKALGATWSWLWLLLVAFIDSNYITDVKKMMKNE